MSTTLLALAKLIAKELGYISGTATSGSTTTLTDSSADSPFDQEDTEKLYASTWLKIEADSAVTPLNVASVRRLKAEGGYTPTTQTVTWNKALDNAITATQSFGIYSAVPPTRFGSQKGLDEYINEILRTRRYRHYQLLSLVTDGDMESTGTTSWTGANSTLAKVTTASSVGEGKQALSVTTTSANGYAESAAIPVTAVVTLAVCADLAGNTGTAKLQLWDATNGAEIDSVNTTERAASTLWLDNATIPSTCYSVKVRLIGEGSGNVAVWDNVSVRPNGPMTVALPSWVQQTSQIEAVRYSYDHGYSPESGVHVRDSREYVNVLDYDILEDYGAANAYRATVPSAYGSSHLFAVGHRYYGELSADTDTTDANQDWIKAEVLASIYRDKEQTQQAQYWAALAKQLSRSPRWQGRAYKLVVV